MAEKIAVESGNPYRDNKGRLATSPNKALEASFDALKGKTFVPKGKGGNEDIVKAKKKEAEELLASLRGGGTNTSATNSSSFESLSDDDKNKVGDIISDYYNKPISEREGMFDEVRSVVIGNQAPQEVDEYDADDQLLYRGTNSKDVLSTTSWKQFTSANGDQIVETNSGTYFAGSEEYAAEYGEVHEFALGKDAKLLDRNENFGKDYFAVTESVTKHFEGDFEKKVMVSDILARDEGMVALLGGYDGFKHGDVNVAGQGEIGIVNQGKLKTKQKLAELRGGDSKKSGNQIAIGDKLGDNTVIGKNSKGKIINDKGEVFNIEYFGDQKTAYGPLSFANRAVTPDGKSRYLTEAEQKYFAENAYDKKSVKKAEMPPSKNDDLSEEQVTAIEDYTSEANIWMNSSLREAAGDDSKLDPADVEEYFKPLDESMTDTIDQDYIYRGTSFEDPGFKEGMEWTDYAYGSAGKTEESGVMWSDPYGDAGSINQFYENQGKDISNFGAFVFKIKTGDNKFLDVHKRGISSSSDDEEEVIVPRGTKYRVVSVSEPQKQESVSGDPEEDYEYKVIELEIIK